MDLELRGRHVLITGGSRGIGLACAQAFLAEGARVSLVARQQSGLDAAVATLAAVGIAPSMAAASPASASSTGSAVSTGSPPAAAAPSSALLESAPTADPEDLPGSRVRGFAADLSDAAGAAALVARVWDEVGPVDVLVNSAGAARRTPPAELTATAWHDAMSAKYFSYIHVIDPLIKRMAERGRGAIVNVIGAGGKFAKPTHLPGGSANAALMLATAGLAQAYAAQGIRVNGVNPGATLTDRLKGGLEAQARLDETDIDTAMARATAQTALGRLAQPSEIADAVVFLASARASYITGVNLLMDGGGTPTVL